MSKKINVAINGFGRIGRSFFRLAFEREDINIVAVNDLGEIDNLMYLLRYDSAQGYEDYIVDVSEDSFYVNGHKVAFFQQKDPAQLPWKEMEIDVVVESTGFFAKYEQAKLHMDAGAKRVVISAPAESPDGNISGVNARTILMGVNHAETGTCQLTSNGSCTTNSIGAVMQALIDTVGVEQAMLSTVHGYTATQSLVDSPQKGDWRRGRAAAVNIVPTSTGAAKTVGKAVTALDGKFDGIAIRVPVVAGSISDVTFIASRATSVEEINEILTAASEDERYRHVFAVTDEPIVSSDIVGSTYAGIVDLALTRVSGGTLVKIMVWYDNEMGYTQTLVDHVAEIGSTL